MPKAVYILCSESGSEDKTTNVVSHFNVIEQIEIRELARPPGSVPFVQALSCRITAVWAKAESDEPSQEYEFRFSLYLPPEGNELPIGSGTFSLEKPRFRAMGFVAGLVFPGTGTFRVECKIRPIGGGEDSWITQSYEIPVIHIKLEASDQITAG
jgi:hypothetical protein